MSASTAQVRGDDSGGSVEREVREVWTRARDIGIYSFATDLSQATYPARTLAGTGGSPRRAALHIEGKINQPDRTLELRLWQPGVAGSEGSATPRDGAEMRIEGDRAYARLDGDRGAWQEVQDFSSSFAPDNDPLAFLGGMKNVRKVQARDDPLTSGASHLAFDVSRFTFDLDGPALATYVRDRLERELSERGELPAGVTLEAPSSLQGMMGNGDLWVDDRGLPLRLAMHVAFPAQQDGSYVEADIQTQFSGFPEQIAAAPSLAEDPLAWANTLLQQPSPKDVAKTGGTGGALACSLGAIALLLACRRSRRLYAAVAVAVILSMVIVPLMQSERTAAFFERQAARSEELMVLGANGLAVDRESARGQVAAQQAVTDTLTSTWDPQQDPLAQPDQPPPQTEEPAGAHRFDDQIVVGGPADESTLGVAASVLTTVPVCVQTDTDDTGDKDGLTKYEECVYFTNPDKEDSDGDGLSDAQELNKLGTNPNAADTDGDLISDLAEVQGFVLPGDTTRWYLDPNNADTNNDGLVDSLDCPMLVDAAQGCDTDGDKIPNAFEVDNDADNVPDRVDLSPDQWVDKGGLRTGQASSASSFDGSNPLKLNVPNLADGWPVLVDLQFRPTGGTALGYANNVLDWPAKDMDGEIQHYKATTFANSDNPDIANPDDEAGAYGDMRLLPLLEIVLTGNEIPLKVTSPAVTITVGSWTPAATITLKPTTDLANTKVTKTLPAGASYQLYAGTCGALGAAVVPVANTADTWTGKVTALADGKHSAVVTVGSTSACAELTDVVNGPYADYMVDNSELDPYGIMVKEGFGNDDTAVVAYVPPNVIADDTGGGKAAFQARMLYYIGGNSHWTQPAQIRLIWLVQMITDKCADGAQTWDAYHAAHPEDDQTQYDAYVDEYCAAHRTADEIVPVQLYDESWYLTGLNLQEAHGLDVAIAYPNPALTYSDDALWTLSWGLGQQFLTGRDCESATSIFSATDPATPACSSSNTVRDLAVVKTDRSNPARTIGDSSIQERFDNTSSNTTHRTRWGIPANALEVDTKSYPHQDYSGQLATKDTPDILKKYTNHAITPSLLFAFETRSRLGDLSTATMTCTGSTCAPLSLDMGTASHPEQTVTGLRWAPFRWNSTENSWETYPFADYFEAQETDLTTRFKSLISSDTDATRAGRVTTARSYTAALIVGVGSVTSATTGVKAGASDQEIKKADDAMLNSGLNHITVEILSDTLDTKKSIKANSTAFDQTRIAQTVELADNITAMSLGTLTWTAATHPEVSLFTALGEEMLQPGTSPWYAVYTAGASVPVTGSVLTGSAASAVISILKAINNWTLENLNISLRDLAEYIYEAIYGAVGIGMIIKGIYSVAFSSAKVVMGFAENFCSGFFAVAGYIITVALIALEWGKFAYLVATQQLPAWSMAFDEALVYAIAYTIFSVAWFILTTALGPFGTILSGIKFIVNALAASLCKAFLTEEQMEEEEWTKWVCGGITGFFVQYYTAILYSGTLIPDLDPDEDKGPPWYPRLNMYNFKPTLQNERQGVTVGNSMRYSIGLTNTIDMSAVPIRSHELIWFWQFNDDNLKQSNFDYKWQDKEAAFHDSLALGGMTWDGTADGRPFYHAETVESSNLQFTQAGINVPVENLYLSEAYAVPEQECWGYFTAKYCYIATEKGTAHMNMGEGMVHDVLPMTVSGFYSWTPKGNGYALSWAQDGDLKFPTLHDFDGDGLSGTDDPDDRTWDADGDSLTDVYELDRGLNPRAKDSDNDGLTDIQEVRLGTDAWSRDTDGDGLLDCQEVRHQVESEGDNDARTKCGAQNTWSGGWSIVYKLASGAQATTWVTSDPRSGDGDGDGISDSKEKIYGYHPRAYSILKVLTLDSTLSEDGQTVSDGFVARGQSLTYNATVKNELDNRHAEGLLWPADSPALEQSTTNPVKPESFVLRPQAEASMAGNLKVKSTAASGTYSVTQVAGALISDLTVESGNPSLWLPLDDPIGSTVFADSSGSEPAHDGKCNGVCTLAPADGRSGGALKLAGTGYVTSDASLPANDYSVSFWFRVNAADGNQGLLFASPDMYSAVIGLENGRIRFRSLSTYGYSEEQYANGEWHHVVYVVPGGTTTSTTLYVDGDIEVYGQRSSWASNQSGVLFGGSPSGSNLVGSIDDVRVFNRALTQLEISKMFEMPIFQMDFNDTSAWKDVSGLPTTVTCTNCPGRTTWAGGGAATFDGSQYLSVARTGKLDLQIGYFTLSAWIYPRTGNGDRDAMPQAILGYNAGLPKEADPDGTYVALERVGKKIRLGVPAGYDWKDLYTSGDVLTESQWNHVALTFDKSGSDATVALYVNGALVTGTPVKLALGSTYFDTANRFDIGRNTIKATWSLDYYKVTDTGEAGDAEICMARDGVEEVWNAPDLGDGQSISPTDVKRDFTGTTKLKIWENDCHDGCGTGPENCTFNDDDTCTITGNVTELVLDKNTTPGFSAKSYDTWNCGTGTFKLTVNNHSIPFFGYMDEVQIYGQAFDQDSIYRLYQDVATALHLRLDEAPGAVAFQDASLAHVAASCLAGSTTCPTSGTAGRLNQAAWFDGSDDSIRLGNFGNFGTTTVSAWAYRTRESTGRQTIVSYKEDKTCGFVLAVEGNYPKFWVNVGGAWRGPAVGSYTIPTNKWVHLAGRYDGANITVWQDGAQVGTYAYSGTMKNDCAGNVAIGSRSSYDQQHWFPGAIDDVWIFGGALPTARITELYEAAPKLHFLFDEARGAKQFADNAGSGVAGTCTEDSTCPTSGTCQCPQAGEGVRGEIGLAAQFDGLSDTVQIPNFGTFGNTTVSAWVRRTGANTARETVMSYKENDGCGFVLDLNDDGASHYPRFYVNLAGSWKSATGDKPVPLNQWVHLAGTYDGKTIRLYMNGEQTAKLENVTGTMKNDCTAVSAIGSHSSGTKWRFPGEIDQVRVYARALTAKEISDQFAYEDAWVEDRESQNITVDYDLPAAEVLMAGGSYLARQAIWVGVRGSDPTSAVDKLELGVQKGSGTVAWTTAAPCGSEANQPEGAWCAQFSPSAQGDYGLYARATDLVGNVGPTSSKVTVYVDDSAPSLTLDQASVERLDVLESNSKDKTWVIHLSGTVSDPAIATGIAGSGIPSDGVRVTLREAGDPDDKTLGDPRQPATISGNKWTLDYQFTKKTADGCYDVEVEAVDEIAGLPGLDSTQVGRHTTVVVDTVTLGARAPQVVLDQDQAIADGEFGSGVTVLKGETTHRPVPVEVDLTAATGADKTRVLLTCQHGNEGSWFTAFDVQAGTLAAGDTRLWEDKLHHWSTCQVQLTTTATTAGGVSGVVKVCGTVIAEWTGDFTRSWTVEFVVHSDTCFDAGCPVSSTPSVSGIQGADVAFRSVLLGSAFVNEVPMTGEVLHLPFEDTPDGSGGLVLRDVAGAGVNGTCSESSSSSCPTTGQVGPSGSAAWFDGVKDNVQVVDDNRWDFAAGQDFTVAVWAKPDTVQPDTRYTDHSIIEKWSGSGGYPYVIRYVDQNDKTYPGKISAARYQGSQPQPTIWSDRVINDGRFHHLALVKTGSTLTLYIDGTSAGTTTDNTTGTTTNSSAIFIGQRGGGSNHFAGMVDDLRIFNRGLSADEVRALYTGSGPLLVLPFEESWMTDGATLPDASGWGHNGTLETGANDAADKSVSGQVGSYALSFDGTDDYVSAGSQIALANASFSVAFWAKRNTAGRNDLVISQGTSGTSTLLHMGFRSTDEFTCAFYSNDLSTAKYTDTGWHHWACTYDAATNTRTIYRDGVQAAQDVASADYQGSGELFVGRYSGTTYFKGFADDVRIYGRALPAQEVADLYHAGWQAVTLPAGSTGADRATWTATVPAGLEGSYEVDLRGRDTAGHVEPVSESSLLWRGEADNLKPRVKLTKKVVNSTTNEYTTVAEDYHLAQTSFNSPCGAGVVTTSETFRSPWYLGLTGDSQKLYRLTAVCQKPNTVTEQATACDSFSNCNTVGATAAEVSYQPSAISTGPDGTAGAGYQRSAVGDEPPVISIVPTVLTTTQYYEPRTVDVTGLVTGTDAISAVAVAVGDAAGPAVLSEPASTPPYTVTWRFPWRLPIGSLPDGATFSATATVTDTLGNVDSATETLTVDVVLPGKVTLALAGNGQPVEPGAIIRESPADLALTWTPSSDGSGLGAYQAAWRIEDAYTTTVQTSLHDPAGPLEAHLTAGEAQQITVGLGSRDTHGNERWQRFGSVIVDGPLTPDYIALSSGAEGDITGSTCTLLGADRRIDRLDPTGRWATQRLYGTWDYQALRLAWTGANWSGDGDLFIYLDTGGGGTTTTFTPYPVAITGTLITLPDSLQADALIWVQDPSTASLLRWNGSAWSLDTALSPDQYRFDLGSNGGQTDLYLPFDLLGTAAGAPLGLLAFAAEEPAEDVGLRVWARLPLANPVNSNLVNIYLAFAPVSGTMPLLHAFRWEALSDGVCPNGTNGVLLAEQHNDAEIDLTVESDPPGATISGVAGGLFWVRDILADLDAAGTQLRFGILSAARTPLPDGQEIAYTVHYRNTGSHTLEGAWLALKARGALDLAEDTIQLGDIPPGGEGSVTFRGTVDRSLSAYGLAAVGGRLYAATNGEEGWPLEWMAAIHRVDRGAPEEMDFDLPELVAGPGAGWLRGHAYDESGVSHVEIEVTGPSGATSTLTCDLGATSGGWSCPWDATAANGGVKPADGDTFTIRLRATDRFGYTTAWTAPRSIRVDAQPPTVTLAAEGGAISASGSRLVRGNGLRLLGESLDNHAVGTVTLCLDQETCRTADLSTPEASSSWWSQWLIARGQLDYVAKTLTIQATDRLGNSLLEPMSVEVVFDNVTPLLGVNQVRTQVPLGSRETILNGDVADGGPDAEVSVRVQSPESPEGDVTRLPAARDGSGWWFNLPADKPGQYTLWVDAEDLAGNVSTAGPFTVDVTCTDAALAVTSLAAEPVEGTPTSLTLTVVISNTGPARLPSGIPVKLAEGTTSIGEMATTFPLASGESQALSLAWAPTGAADYEVAVSVGEIANLPNGPLCVAPGTANFTVSLRAATLYAPWSLISPAVNPTNMDVQVVQRGINGAYTAILGYDGGLQAYYPDRPGDSTLTAVDALHGYWVHTPALEPADPETDDPMATWRFAGEMLPEDQPVPLAAGWNLAGYLPRQPLTVTAALQGISGHYAAVLGFERTGMSYYPGLDPSYNTLYRMAPGYGYWISATQAITLQYPLTTLTNTLRITDTLAYQDRLAAIRAAEQAAGVQPTYEWMNFYGKLALPDGTDAPTGTVVLAVDPQGVICGATAAWEVGQYGLLACYRDDPETTADEGGLPGDAIRLVISTDGRHPDGQVIGTGMWTAHGARQQVPAPPRVPRAYLPLVWQGTGRESRSWLPLIFHRWTGLPAELAPVQEPFVSPVATPEPIEPPEATSN